MKIFISWSGDLSKKIAQILKQWLPGIIQSVEVFYSEEDIEKGEDWDKKISAQLSECNYGIICLTSENTNAPWVNFEAGAIAKTLESRVTALMIDIKPSDIQGPLRRYQATKLEKDDIYHLILDINNATENPIASEVLNKLFEAVWDKMSNEINSSIQETIPKNKKENSVKKIDNNEAIEEILQLVRKQNTLLNSPTQLLPPDYFEFLQQKTNINNLAINNNVLDEEIHMLVDMVENVLKRIISMKKENENAIISFIDSGILKLLHFIIFNIINDKKMNISRIRIINIKNMLMECIQEQAINETI